MDKKKIIALIPARGGSKTLPRKNILPLNGKPLISYSIETALESTLIDRIIVSTDDEEIKKVSIDYGAEVPFVRPSNISNDKTTDFPVFEHCIDTLEDKIDIIVHLTPTSPVRKTEIVDAAIEKFIAELDNGATSLRSVSFPRDNPFKMWTINNNKLVNLVKLDGVKEPYNQPRQDLPYVYWQNGYVDITTSNTIKKYKSVSGPNIYPFIVNEKIFDIDHLEQLKATEKFLQSGEPTELKTLHLPG
jgi:CMP-N,N'-diacetyllegionaminic acid synthase